MCPETKLQIKKCKIQSLYWSYSKYNCTSMIHACDQFYSFHNESPEFTKIAPRFAVLWLLKQLHQFVSIAKILNQLQCIFVVSLAQSSIFYHKYWSLCFKDVAKSDSTFHWNNFTSKYFHEKNEGKSWNWSGVYQLGRV